MQVKPNQTVVEGKVTDVRPSADGWGADVDLEVLRNLSPARESDFIRPEPGNKLTVFAAEPQHLPKGGKCRVRLTLLGGPHGGRPVVESAEPAG